MSWFKENKFLGVLLIITSICAICLTFLGFKQKAKKEELLSQIESEKASISKMSGMDPYPSPENVIEKRRNLKKVVNKATQAQEAIIAFAPLVIENISVNAFTELFDKTEASIKELYQDKVSVPEAFHLGFERYKGEPPLESATGILAYQMGAFDWLFREIESAGISEISNFVRTELAPERGEDWSGPELTRQQKKNARRANKGNRRGNSSVEIAHKLPFEITFSGREESVRQVLSSIANSDQYYFVTRALRISNPGKAPSNQALSFAKPRSFDDEIEEASGLFDEVETVEEASEEEEEIVQGSRILQRVAGGENLKVYLHVDLLLFNKELKFPEIK